MLMILKILKIFKANFSRFGLTMALDKTKTMVFNGTEHINQDSLVYLDEEAIENVSNFRYLGHVLSPENPCAYLHHQISAAYQKWAEMKVL